VSDNQNRVSVVDTVTRQSIGSIPVGSHPQGVALTPDDKYLFVANQFSDSVDVIDTATNLVVFTRAVPSDPVSLGAFISPPLVRARQAIEFYHAFFRALFRVDPGRDRGARHGVFAGWAHRQTFNVFDLGSGHADVCRFFTTAFAPKSSHFYTPLAFECDLVKQNPDWIYEKIAFQLRLPEAGACPTGTIPLYRLYNNGLTGAPNHRYTTSTAIRTQMIAQGYVPEDDNTACVPPQGGE
jgi:YVTN family beta-propeller protein